MRRFFAPGKVVLVGEYAVLDGAPAVVAAVDRGVRCTVTPAEAPTWTTPTGDDRYVAAALRAAGAPAAHYAFTDHNPVDLGTKAGLGGSAAATVAAFVAAGHLRGEPLAPAALHAAAFAVHHAVQGSGSGIDLAAASHGGVQRFQAGQVRALPPRCPTVVFSGTSASTGPRVAQYRAWSDRDAFVQASAAVVDRYASEPVAALREAAALLGAMAREAGIAYWTEGLRALVALAADCGGAAKPSGAGGGDVVVALFDDPERDAAFRRRAHDAGFSVITTSLSEGARELHG